MEPIPLNVLIGLVLGGLSAFLFFIANLYVILHFIQKIIFPKREFKLLKNMGKKWHKIHYFGNLSAVIFALTHGILLLSYASFWHWILIALLLWMAFSGITIRFTKAPIIFKKILSRFHSKFYMLLIVIILLIISHIASLPNFPYPLG